MERTINLQTNTIKNLKEEQEFSHYEINYNKNGKIKSVTFFNLLGQKEKKIFYDNNEISKIQNYAFSLLYNVKIYKHKKLIEKKFFDRNGDITTTIKYYYEYSFKNNKITSIIINSNYKYEINYEYDKNNNIISQTLYKNGVLITKESFKYDIYGRIIEFKNKSETYTLLKTDLYDNLIKYQITNELNHTKIIINHFDTNEYQKTIIIKNDNSIEEIQDITYADNINFKKIIANEESAFLLIKKSNNNITKKNKLNYNEISLIKL